MTLRDAQEDFVRKFYDQKKWLMEQYFAAGPDAYGQQSPVARWIDELVMDEDGIEKIRKILDSVITDVMYSTLLGLDGAGSIGGSQEDYRVYDEPGNELTSDGRIEVLAYDYFHGTKRE